VEWNEQENEEIMNERRRETSKSSQVKSSKSLTSRQWYGVVCM
jgi:hypothetical protein